MGGTLLGIDRIGVVIPVHDEQDTLVECLSAMEVAASRAAVPVTVIVVLDACTDRSADIVAGFGQAGIESIVIDERRVGSARAAGMAELLGRHRSAGVWLATTDADSVVPQHWLLGQLSHAHAGARVVAGTVTVEDWGERSADVAERARSEYRAGPHRHIHGANLSFSADAYRAAGGFAPVTTAEDVRLVEAFSANGEPIAWAVDLAVVTSARREARAPSGFAHYLSSLEEPLSEGHRTVGP
ncbi:glycosyltransferase [Mycolicibacterium komossense]|uniref:4,4'-diaponeurosporenoate glycosyltransferase n=1 Tax=Mycolicibacterium komossense TaxID=1779 RepID=A0ABT3CMY0_9MYCO|nr:glycosyltransferase [Mycolicibacterium komossense]MCV7230810.1 glycosyltransferase [Mycolicibacterium komossense]